MRAACFCLSFTAASPPLPSTSTAASSPRCQSHASYRWSQPRHSRGGVVRALHERLLETPTPAPAETEVEDESGVGEIEDGGEREGRDGQADIVGPSEAQEQPKSRRRQQQEEEDATAERARFKLINGKEIFQEKTYLVGVECKRAARDNFSIEESLKELEQLADTAGLMVLGSTYQKQLRNLEKSFGGGVRVCDRTALILDIFNQRAATHEAALQVTLAQMEYQLPRLTKLWTHLERQSGGQVKGMGEKQIEVDKRILRTQISTLRKELESVRKHRKLYRNRRRSVPIPVVSLVGYTNAGKSTLLNRLTGADVLAEDKLFATLDPTTRRVLMKSGTEFLLTDTVGFIQKLPTMLVAAFRATLEEISESSIIVHLADIRFHTLLRLPNRVLFFPLGNAGRFPSKPSGKTTQIDNTDNPLRVKEEAEKQGIICISAMNGDGLEEFCNAIQAKLKDSLVPIEAFVPYDKGDMLNDIHKVGMVEKTEYMENGTLIKAHVPLPLARLLTPLRQQVAAPL
ncbi:GTPase HflX isoform X3 [Triticum urartu]|uniref:GTPase HflX isoform X3 n=1 Tax=Triticum urartu TaxID=4572 RepID=UPI002043731E|nr:GTPase HflX isoform X3 [Triticum urartu]